MKWDPQKATLLLEVPEIHMDPRLVSYARENGFIPKPELHVTVLSFQNGKKILQAGGSAIGRIPEIAGEYEWGTSCLPGYFVLERTIGEFVLNGRVETPAHTRRTVIQRVSVPDLAPFLERVSGMTGVAFADPFPHITLFSWSDYGPEMTTGIGLNSEDDFTRYFKQDVVL